MSGKRYTEAFKAEAVKQVLERGHSTTSPEALFAMSHPYTTLEKSPGMHLPEHKRQATPEKKARHPLPALFHFLADS